jgi:hypothetical protein
VCVCRGGVKACHTLLVLGGMLVRVLAGLCVNLDGRHRLVLLLYAALQAQLPELPQPLRVAEPRVVLGSHQMRAAQLSGAHDRPTDACVAGNHNHSRKLMQTNEASKQQSSNESARSR